MVCYCGVKFINKKFDGIFDCPCGAVWDQKTWGVNRRGKMVELKQKVMRHWLKKYGKWGMFVLSKD